MAGSFEDAMARIARALPADRMLSGETAGARYHSDWTRRLPCAPRAVVKPRSTVEVSAVLAACHAAFQPVVVQGGLTGLSGGATPKTDEIAVSLEALTGVESVDVIGATLQVCAGATLAAVQDAALEHSLQFSLDIGARGSCTIGGNLATNAGGNRVIRYGMARDLVLGVEAVLADGTIVSQLNSMLKNNAGYDLKQLFIGTEGTLGIITRAVLKLHPAPRDRLTAFVAINDFNALVNVLGVSRAALGPQLASFEVMWGSYYEFALDSLALTTRPFKEPYAYYALIELEVIQAAADTERFESMLAQLMESGSAADIVLAHSAAESLSLWRPRDAAGELISRYRRGAAYDVSLPISAMPTFVDRVLQDARVLMGQEALHVFGHLGDGNLHLMGELGDVEAEALDRVIYGALSGIGSVSAEHGIGTLKRSWLPASRSEPEIELMRLLKRSLDPRNILNPGRII